MTNPLFGMLGGNPQTANIIQQFQRFRNTFQGNPQQQIQQLLNSGKISQEQYNNAVKQAQALRSMLGM